MSSPSAAPLPRFADLDPELCAYETSEVVILPAPLEATTSYGQGTARGPAALLEASRYLELWDEELGSEPCEQGIATLPPLLHHTGEKVESYLGRLEAAAREHLTDGKFLVTLGGEHSLSAAPIRAARAVHGEIGVVQFDAHSDLRDTYEGTPLSHACVMHRVLDEGIPALAVGIRSLSAPEARLIRERDLPVLWAYELATLDTPDQVARFERALDGLPDALYLTFDVDYFDPSLLPATGTPEPGGGEWYPTLALLRSLFRRKRVVAMDVVELAPAAGSPVSDFVAAKLLYKCLGYRRAGRGHR